jgi:hypothetical protein
VGAFDDHAKEGHAYWLGWLEAVAKEALRYLESGRPDSAAEELRRGLAEVENALPKQSS